MNDNTIAQKTSLASQAYRALLDRLLRNELVPGEILNRRSVAEELGISVAPVLEAMLQLEHEGFLDTIPRKGTRVRPVRAEDVIGSLIVREALECQAARIYCGPIIAQHVEELRPLARGIEETRPDEAEHWEHEIRFHQALVDLAGIPMLSEEFRRCIQLNVFFRLNKLLASTREHDQRHHDRLLTELAVATPDVAEQLTRDHVRSGKGHLLNHLS